MLRSKTEGLRDGRATGLTWRYCCCCCFSWPSWVVVPWLCFSWCLPALPSFCASLSSSPSCLSLFSLVCSAVAGTGLQAVHALL